MSHGTHPVRQRTEQVLLGLLAIGRPPCPTRPVHKFPLDAIKLPLTASWRVTEDRP